MRLHCFSVLRQYLKRCPVGGSHLIQFLLNQELQQEHNLDPNLTVLNYLRDHQGKTGTKEGCASGDCGACTVVTAELDTDHNKLTYRSINSCLAFVATLHGKQLITIEDLHDKQNLHSTQQAMADCHGSQCGFCTPGFVMSLFALQKSSSHYDKGHTIEALSGNLCRCTGYRPIYQAAEQACNNKQDDQFDKMELNIIERLKKIQPQANTTLTNDKKSCFIPTSTQELADLYIQHPEAQLFAGGTDLALEVTQFHRPLMTTIYLGNIKEMQTVTISDDTITIGAATPLSQCYQALSQEYPDFGELLHRFASLQIRNQGTLGGNIANASPIGDAPPLLIALAAKIQLRQGNTSRTILLEEYFLDYKKTAQQPSEFIERILVPKKTVQKEIKKESGKNQKQAPSKIESQFKAYKISKRLDDDISAVCAAFNLTIEDEIITTARIAFGGMAAIPKRAHHCEQILINQTISSDVIEQACLALTKDFTPLNDFRASAEYRILCAQNLLRKYFIELAENSDQSSTYLATRVTAHV